MIGTLVSENFTNDAAQQGGVFYSDERPVESGYANSASFSISYDATAQSYTVSTGSRTRTFTQADEVSSGSTDYTAYEKSSGSVHDSLSLTVPGTSGDLTYQYVGGGAWESVTIGTTLDFTYNPFTYGVETPNSDLQRSGTGLFSVSLVGARESGKPYAMAGSGTMQVDFGASSLSSSGVLTTIDVSTSHIISLGIFYGAATLSSSANSFSGSFAMDDGTRFNGGWDGRFYGPDNQEVGAVWYVNNGDEFAAGYLLGRADNTITAYNTSLDPIRFSEDFEERYSELNFADNGDGTAASGAYSLRSDGKFSANVSNGSYHYVDSGQSIDTTFAFGDFNAGKSSSSVDVYEMTDGGTPYRLTILKPGSGNPTIALSYTSFGRWQQMQTGSTDARDRWFAWGVRTNAFQIPTGTGHFDGIIAGSGATTNGGALYDISGTSSFDVNFGAGTFTGALHPTGTNLSTMATQDFGSFSFSNGLMDIDGGLNAYVVDGSSNYLGYFEGALFGPDAAEIGGSFGFNTTSSVNGSTVTITGATVGKRN